MTFKQVNKIERGSIKLQLAGDLMMARCEEKEKLGLFKRYEAILECFANMERFERMINYKFFVGLILTSHAKKITDRNMRKEIFSLKNEIFLDLANNPDTRRKLAFLYLTSKNFLVAKYCPTCEAGNAEKERSEWKHCEACTLDRKFYNILSIHHKFGHGSCTLFLSNDQIEKVNNLKLNRKAPLEKFKEEARYKNYHYNVKNMDVFDIDSVLAIHKKLLSDLAG